MVSSGHVSMASQDNQTQGHHQGFSQRHRLHTVDVCVGEGDRYQTLQMLKWFILAYTLHILFSSPLGLSKLLALKHNAVLSAKVHPSQPQMWFTKGKSHNVLSEFMICAEPHSLPFLGIHDPQVTSWTQLNHHLQVT